MPTTFVVYTFTLAIHLAVGSPVKEMDNVKELHDLLQYKNQVAILIYEPGCPGCSAAFPWFKAVCEEYKDVTCIQTNKAEVLVSYPKDLKKFDKNPWIGLFPEGNEKTSYEVTSKGDVENALKNLIGK